LTLFPSAPPVRSGPLAGALLFVGAAERLTSCLRTSDSPARLGGDEFAVLLEDLVDEADAIHAAERILSAFGRPFQVEGTEVAASASIGIAFAADGSSCEQLLRNADLAMYTAKRQGKGRVATYQHGMHASAVERLELEADLRHAIDRRELRPHYQPVVDLATQRVVGVEALVRWHHPIRGLMTPTAFLPVAEEAGLLGEIGRSVMSEASADLRRWRSDGLVDDRFTLSVNVAPEQLLGGGMVTLIEEVTTRNGLDPSMLVVEVTEGAMVRDTDEVIAALSALRALGVRVAIDDFGTGYSSLAYLQKLPVDILKVDKSFVDGIDGAAEEAALPHAIIRLAQTLHLTAVAEGVERTAQAVRLRELGCERAQGFLFARPMPAASLSTLLRRESAVVPCAS
jgi:predicted signal transduction protein with EAL and GGDEF domain